MVRSESENYKKSKVDVCDVKICYFKIVKCMYKSNIYIIYTLYMAEIIHYQSLKVPYGIIEVKISKK